MLSLHAMILYVIHTIITILHVDIRYSINILYRTSNIICPWKLYRIYDIVYTISYTTSNTRYTISYILTYDIVGDIQYHMWQESRWSRFAVANWQTEESQRQKNDWACRGTLKLSYWRWGTQPKTIILTEKTFVTSPTN